MFDVGSYRVIGSVARVVCKAIAEIPGSLVRPVVIIIILFDWEKNYRSVNALNVAS